MNRELELRVAKFLKWPDSHTDWACIIDGEPWWDYHPFSMRIFQDALYALDCMPFYYSLTNYKNGKFGCTIGTEEFIGTCYTDAICKAVEAWLNTHD